jgi:hypothetical protein
MTKFWAGTNIPKSSGNAFTERPAVVFANDPGERAKATLARLIGTGYAPGRIHVEGSRPGHIPQAMRTKQ